MPKIYLSPAYHKYNACCIPGCDETTHNNLYLDELEPYLEACGIEYKRGTRRVPKSNENGTVLMNKAIAESNAWNPDIHYISHTNGYNGEVNSKGDYIKYGSVKGYRPMIYTNAKENCDFAEIMLKWRKKIYPYEANIYVDPSWDELSQTTAIAFYEEHVFHDNPDDAKWFHDNLRLIAEHTARAFCEYFKIEFVDPYAKPNGFWRLYEIEGALSTQRGAYSNKEGLLKHAEQLLDEGKIIRYEWIKK